MPGWKAPTDKVRRFSDLPPNAQAYIRKIEELLEVPGRSLGFKFSDDMWAHWGKYHGICSRNSKQVNKIAKSVGTLITKQFLVH